MTQGTGRVSGADLTRRARQVREAHERFLTSGGLEHGLRPLVEESWRRCLSGGLDPEHTLAPVDLLDDDLATFRGAHPLAEAMPVIRRLLVEDAAETGLLVAVSDAAGRLLWVEGQHRLRSDAENIHFVAGALWSEAIAGTNAPGTALALERPVQILAAEHLSRPVTRWSCTAAPIHDPDTGALLGALDLTGGDDVASPRTLPIVRATVAAVESELRVRRLADRGPASRRTPDRSVLHTLGRGTATLAGPHGALPLGLRHSELLVLLAAHPEGLTGEQLDVALHDRDHAPVTLRAELSRLRTALAPLRLRARPYRLEEPPALDADEVRGRLAAGDLGGAVARYPGPLLPASEAPGVARLRSALHEDLRTALLRAGDPDALLRFADTEHGRYDWQLWRAAAHLLPATSARGPAVHDHVAFLERELGGGPR